MSLAAWIISGLLLSLLALFSYALHRILRAVRVLSDARIGVYSDRLSELHEMLHAMRGRTKMPRGDVKVHAQMNLFASFPTMRADSEAIESLSALARKQLDAAPASEISAAEQAAEKALVALNVAMREDLSLNTGTGRLPNAEVFRGRRGRS